VNYYNIALPLKPDKLFTYSSKEAAVKGCRVLVSFHNQIYTGIVWEKITEMDPAIKYKPILEMVDTKPLILPDLLELAAWISRYYHTSLGITLSAMLPAAFNVQVQLKAKRTSAIEPQDSDASTLKILDQLKTEEWTDIARLKKNNQGLYKLLEDLEDKKLIDIRRVTDNKIKPKTVNFIIQDELENICQLTSKQNEAFKVILEQGNEFPLSSIAKEFSYSIIKSLVKKKIIRIESRKVYEESKMLQKIILESKKIKLNDEQLKAVKTINDSLAKSEFSTFLLYGITGSGKTEVYIAVIKRILAQKKTALMLVPEIALTPQMVSRFFSVFGNEIAVLHSQLNDRERWQEWRDIRSGRKKIVIGARSAVFAPLRNIGVIFVDEEQVNSYKQESNPRYNGRDMAVLRAKLNNAVCILGSATPSLESWFNVTNQKFKLIQLKKRPLNYLLPQVEVIDLRKAKMLHDNFSEKLITAIETRLKKQEQILLLHNRRGYSSFVQCVACGKLFECPHCDISMNYHSTGELLKCHYCGYQKKLPRKCDECGGYVYNFGSPGTQQLEKQLKILFPQARILRMDSDTARKRDSYDSMFQRMKNGSVDILLGTQMIAKGLDFENVTLVGVILADQSLNIPDFRAAENTFQLLTQVAGRSGRGEKPGQVLIQTFNPEHYAIAKAFKQDFESFALRELELRKDLFYPPYRKLARLLFTSTSEKFIKTEVRKLSKLRQILNGLYPQDQLIILGPVEAPFVKLQKKYRFHIIIKCDCIKTMSEVINYFKSQIKLKYKVSYSIDVDPLSLL
jgi:primosomal protein N' (replication factor Y) (superfamily II helicase)